MKMQTLSWTALASSLLASLCCIGPALLALVGVGGAAWLSAFDNYRPYLIGLTGIFLGVAFYFSYRRQPACADGSCPPKQSRGFLWTASLFSLGFIVYPFVDFSPEQQADKLTDQVHVAIPVAGMTCKGCEQSVENALADVSGIRSVRAEYRVSSVDVVMDSEKVSVSSLVDIINTKTPYRATHPKQKETP